MEFRIDCNCGNHLMVSEGAAGAVLSCSCGRPIMVPSLSELRTGAGLPANTFSPELIIEHLLAIGEIPMGNECVECGTKDFELIHVRTECERAFTKRAGAWNWVTRIILAFAHIIVIGEPEEQRFGRDKVYPLPLRVCKDCQRKLRNSICMKQCLHKIPEYQALLDKFPDATVSMM